MKTIHIISHSHWDRDWYMPFEYHRSYLINPVHVKVLRKDKEGVVYAELDAPEVQHIPVTKRYYASVSSLL